MSAAVLGIDIAKETFEAMYQQDERKAAQQFENTPRGHRQLVVWLEKLGGHEAHVCMEATGQYGDVLAEYLCQHGFRVSVVNPARVKHYGNSKLRRNKTDKADAQLIAEFCLTENPPLWTPPSAIFKELRALVRHLDDLQVSLQQEKNRLQSGVPTPKVLEHLKALIALLEEQIHSTKLAIQQLIDADPELKKAQDLLASISGVGRLTAAKLLGEIRNICDFDNANQLAAYAGVTPRLFLSGTSVHKKSRLSKTGRANLRKILYFPAICARHYNPIVQNFCDRLSLSGLTSMEVIGAAMHKLICLIFGVLKHGRPFDPDYLIKLQVPS